MHVGIATAATAALVFSGAALFQSNATPTPGGTPAATAPVAVGSLADAETAARMVEMSRAMAQSRDIIAQQERDLARARGEIESMQLRVRSAEERAAALEADMFQAHRTSQIAREDAARAADDLRKAARERDAAMSRLRALEATAAATPPTPPATYQPDPNPAREVLNTLKIADGDDSETLGMVMAQTAIREAKVYLRNERLAEIKLDGSNALRLPNRQLTLGELVDLINATGSSPMGLEARQMPDGRIAIDMIDSWDRASRALVIYDLSDLAQRERARALSGLSVSRGGTILGIMQVITKTVTPDLWQDNDGELGAISVLDSSLVVTAPERSHHQIRWIIEQVRSSSSRVEVPILSDLPLVDVTPVEAGDRREVPPLRMRGNPAPIESKGEAGK